MRQSIKSWPHVVEAYEAALEIDSARPGSPPISVHDSASSIPSPLLRPVSQPPVHPFSKEVSPLQSAPPGAPYPELPPPSEWCTKCRRICNHVSAECPALQCGECRSWSHVQCIKDASPYTDVEWNSWVCQICEAATIPLSPPAIWTDAL